MRTCLESTLLCWLPLFLQLPATADPLVAPAPQTAAQDKPLRTDALGDPLPPGAIARLGTLRFKHTPSARIATALFAPDGKTIAATDFSGGVVRLWDARTGKEQRRFSVTGLPRTSSTGCTPNNDALAFSPDSAILAAGLNKAIVLWDVATGQKLRSLEGHKEYVLAVVFADGGKTLISAGMDGAIRWWDVASGKEVRSLTPFPNEQKRNWRGAQTSKMFTDAVFAPDAQAVAVQIGWREVGDRIRFEFLERDGVAIVFQLATGKQLWSCTKVYQYGRVLTFSPDSKRLAVHLNNPPTYDLRICDAVTGNVLAKAPVPRDNLRYTTAFSPDGGLVAIACLYQDIDLWPVGSKAKPRKISASITAHDLYTIRCLAFSPDGTKLLVASSSSLQLLDVATGAPVQPWPGHGGPVQHVAFATDGRRLVTSGVQTWEALTWETASWKLLHRSTLDRAKLPQLATPSLDHAVCVGLKDKTNFAFFDMPTGKKLGQLLVPAKSDYRDEDRALFSENGRFCFFHNRSAQPGYDLYAVPSGKHLCRLPTFGWIHDRAFSADNRLVAFHATDDGLIKVYETGTGKLLWRLGKPPPELRNYVYFAPPIALAFTADGKLLASCNKHEADIQVWDLATGKQRCRFPGKPWQKHRWEGACLAWSGDGRTLAVGGMGGDFKIQLWELASRKLRAELTGHEDVVRALAFSPDSRLLASGSADTTVLIWDLGLGQP